MSRWTLPGGLQGAVVCGGSFEGRANESIFQSKGEPEIGWVQAGQAAG